MKKIRKRTLLVTTLTLLVFCSAIGAGLVRLAAANFMPFQTPQPAFVILSDGTLSTASAPIQRVGDVYRLTDNIFGYTIAIERDNVILDGNGYVLQGNGNSTGVFVVNRNNVTIRNMDISGFSTGIKLCTDVYAYITGNHTVCGNNISNNGQGINLFFTKNNVLRNNQLNNNLGSIYVTYSPLSTGIGSFINDIDTSNMVNGKPIIYWVNQHDRAVPEDAGFVALINCTNMVVQNLDVTENCQGIMLAYTSHSTITGNTITNSANQGIYMYQSSNNSITENSIVNSEEGGVYLWYSSDNTISANTISENSENGIYLSGSSRCTITGNTITQNNNGIQVYSSGTNNSITGNTITKNTEYGVAISWITSNNSISENSIERNGNGILVEESANNRIIGNMVKENVGWGIRLEGGQRDNIIYHNHFVDNNIENGMQVSIPGLWTPTTWDPGNPNVWDDGETGNYWSDYMARYPNATEVGDTGIGDMQFYINPNNIDRYPVMDYDLIPEFPSWLPTLLALAVLTVAVTSYKHRLHRKTRNKKLAIHKYETDTESAKNEEL